MTRRSWPAEDDALLRELYPRTRTDELPRRLLDWAEKRPELTTLDLLETLGVKPPTAKAVKT